MSAIYTSLNACPICSSREWKEVLNLGDQATANQLPDSRLAEVPVVPLRLCFCLDCKTLFLREIVDPSYLFSDYIWVTCTSASTIKYSHYFAEACLTRLDKKSQLAILEIASNDGTFLKRFQERGHAILGVDPAKNIAEKAIADGIATEVDFFNMEVADRIKRSHGSFDFVFARNVIPHVADIHGVIGGIKNSLGEGAIGAIEFHYAGHILKGLQYDSIYHEHLYYFSLYSLCFLLEKYGLFAFDVFDSPISGGSLVLFFSLQRRAKSEALRDLEKEERGKCSILDRSTWEEFAKKCLEHREKLREIVRQYVDAGRHVVGYGASARSSTLLNFSLLKFPEIKAIADLNPLKQGKFTAGSNIAINSPSDVFATKPDVVLPLAWNFKDEILRSLREEYSFDKDVIIPLPDMPSCLVQGKEHVL